MPDAGASRPRRGRARRAGAARDGAGSRWPQFRPVDVVVGSIPPALIAAVVAATGRAADHWRSRVARRPALLAPGDSWPAATTLVLDAGGMAARLWPAGRGTGGLGTRPWQGVADCVRHRALTCRALAALERGAFADPWTRGTARRRDGLARSDRAGRRGRRARSSAMFWGGSIVDEAEILSIATIAERRREGIGRRLLDAVIDVHDRARGARRVARGPGVERCGSRAMYQSAGFVAAGVRRGYYRQPTGGCPGAAARTRRQSASRGCRHALNRWRLARRFDVMFAPSAT